MRRRMPYGLGLLAVLALLIAACSRPAEPKTEIVPIHVESVEVQILKSNPAQVQAAVKGVVGDSCSTLDKVTQTRSGNSIVIRITAVRTLDVPCMEMAQLYDQVIKLDGSFPPGSYQLNVNGVIREFRV
jgi:hypothetical protein